MEVFAAVGSIASIYNNVKSLPRSLESDGLYVRLITEQARFSEWKRRMGIENSEDMKVFLGLIPEDAREFLMMIFTPFGKCLEESQELFKRYGIGNPLQSDRRFSLKDKLRRADFLFDGERELTKLLNTLKDLNDGLLVIAPPAPCYYFSQSDPILESSQPTQQLREHSQFRQTGYRSQQAQATHTFSQDQTSQIWDDIASKQKDSRGGKDFHSLIDLLYSTSLGVLRTATVLYPTDKPLFEEVLQRFNLWGSGLFQGKISIDQALNQQSSSVEMLRNNIAGTLASIAITLEYMLSILGEPTESILILRLKSMFSIAEISHLLLDDEPSEIDNNSGDERILLLKRCTQDLSELIECLYRTLPTLEMVFQTVLARQTQNPALDERAMLLLKSESDISLSNMRSAPTKELLEVDLKLIAAMRRSLKDTDYVKYMEQKDPAIDPKQLYKQLGEESAQIKYWTSSLVEEKDGITEETQAAMMLNLARIARVFAASCEPPSNSRRTPPDLDEIQEMIRRCRPYISEDEADEEALLLRLPIISGDGSTISTALDVLKSSNLELRRLAGSKNPGMSYQKDFSLIEKEKEKEPYSQPARSLDDLEVSKAFDGIVDCKRVGYASRGADDTSNFGANAAKELAALTAFTSLDSNGS